MIIKCILGILLGYVSHVFFHKPTARFGNKWGLLLRYAIGYIGCIPLRQLFLDENEKRVSERVFMADIISGVMFGAGVFLGHLADNEE